MIAYAFSFTLQDTFFYNVNLFSEIKFWLNSLLWLDSQISKMVSIKTIKFIMHLMVLEWNISMQIFWVENAFK